MPCSCWARPSTCWSSARTPWPPSSTPTTTTSPCCGAPSPPSARAANSSGCWGFKRSPLTSLWQVGRWPAPPPPSDASDGDQTPACYGATGTATRNGQHEDDLGVDPPATGAQDATATIGGTLFAHMDSEVGSGRLT